MERFLTLTAIGAPMPAANISTDDIFPGPTASPILRKPENAAVATDRSKMGLNAFSARRWDDDGLPRPEFVLNRPPWNRARILLTGENFGCGSSREMAVWCLQAIGISCLIGSSFGDIFRNNCFRNGLLPVTLDAAVAEYLLAQAATGNPCFTVNLEQELVTAPDGSQHRFETPAYNRIALLEGLDEIGATLHRMQRIEEFERAYFSAHPWLVDSESNIANVRRPI